MNHSHMSITAVFSVLLLVFTGCLRKQEYIPINKTTLKGSGKVYFVPLGDFPAPTVNELASFYRIKYQIPVQIRPSVSLSQGVMNPERDQLIAEQAVQVMRQANADIDKDPQAILIGITEEDMYISKYDWQFSFNWREEGRYAVVSSARMWLPNREQPVSEQLVLTRLRKMITKNLGILYYHLPQSDNPRSVLYRNIGGIRELDYMGEEF